MQRARMGFSENEKAQTGVYFLFCMGFPHEPIYRAGGLLNLAPRRIRISQPWTSHTIDYEYLTHFSSR